MDPNLEFTAQYLEKKWRCCIRHLFSVPVSILQMYSAENYLRIASNV